MRNVVVLEKSLGSEKLAQLDEEDLLNPEEAIRREQLGIDINFMVKRLG